MYLREGARGRRPLPPPSNSLPQPPYMGARKRGYTLPSALKTLNHMTLERKL